jgi:GNAT superfamily N-acetyltransferase
MQIQIKPATQTDIETIRDIAWKGWYPYYLRIISEEQIRFMYATSYSAESLECQMEQGHRFLLLYADGQPAVMASFSLFIEERAVWKLHKLYSDPSFQGKGLGKAMLDAVCREVKQQHANQLQLNVNRSNPTYQFYLKYGFKVLWEEDIPFGPYWMNDYRMAITV